MIVKTKETKKEFKPFTIELTIETEDELYELWHRLNLGFDDIREKSCHNVHDYPFPNTYTITPFWSVLDNKLEQLRGGK